MGSARVLGIADSQPKPNLTLTLTLTRWNLHRSTSRYARLIPGILVGPTTRRIAGTRAHHRTPDERHLTHHHHSPPLSTMNMLTRRPPLGRVFANRHGRGLHVLRRVRGCIQRYGDRGLLAGPSPMWKTRRLRPRPAGSPEAPFRDRSCLRLP